MTEQNELMVRGETQVAMVNPIANALEQAGQLGEWMAKSGLFGCKNIEEGKVMAMTCILEKISPMEYLDTYDTVKGRPRMKSSAMLAKFIKHGGAYKVIERSDKVCVIDFTWRDEVIQFSFDIEEAKKAGLVKTDSGWDKWTKNMLFARCVTNYLRTHAPELFAGQYSVEEMRDDVPSAPPPVQPVKPLFAENVKEENPLSKPIEERMDVEVLPPEGKEIERV